MAKIAIIGGGIAGSTAALYLCQIGLDVTLFEKRSSLVSGPPFCHLHAGGNLYREIDDTQCVTLLHQSIDLLKFYPYAIDYRPTVIAIPIIDSGNPYDLKDRLLLLRDEYKKSIKKDPSNKVLGEVDEYFKFYSKDDILALQINEASKHPKNLDEWMVPVAKNLDLEKIKFPLVIVQEYGLNLFRLASGVTKAIEKLNNCNLQLNTKIQNVKKDDHTNKWIVDGEKFDYLINAAGFETGIVDDILSYKRERFVEFKAAYITKWDKCDDIWPEVIFHGQRGTPNGMAQFTPYPNGYFQLHGMTNDITLFENGLVKSSQNSSQPSLDPKFINKIYKNWEKEDIESRTKLAIKHICKFIPQFCGGSVASKPLYGAQQIPGDNKELRAADVSFESDNYARCEVVKASSVLTMCDSIMEKLILLEYVDKPLQGKRNFDDLEILFNDIEKYAQDICTQRGYPSSLALINRDH